MSNQVNFNLPTCTGITPDLWTETAANIDLIIKNCKILSIWLLAINVVYNGVMYLLNKDLENDLNKKPSLRSYNPGYVIAIFKACLQAILIMYLLFFYKDILIYFDKLIDRFCVFDQNFEGISKWRVVRILHYIRVTTLLVVSKLGPLAVLLILLPDPFKRLRKGFEVWLDSYITLSCLAININISGELARMFSKTSLLIKDNSSPNLLPNPKILQESFEHTLLTIIIFIVTALTSAWAYKSVNKAITSNLRYIFNNSLEGLGLRHKDKNSSK